MNTEGGLFIGLMSGTSLDGIDGVLVEFDAAGKIRSLRAHAHRAFEPTLRDELLALQSSGPDELHRAALASNRLVRSYAQVVARLIEQAHVESSAVACVSAHGQTVRHRPEIGYTSQLNNPALLAELTAIPVVADHRSRDIAAGGQGAPLVPAFHRAAFAQPNRRRLIVNLGGIGNVTVLNGEDTAVGHDFGPANVLLDTWVQRHLGEPFDRNGAWASIGEVDDSLLEVLLDEPYFSLPPHKSTGRDLFNENWLDAKLRPFPYLAPEDVQRTLVELTAELIGREAEGTATYDVVLCGGGAYNQTLIEALRSRLAGTLALDRVRSSHDFGIAPEHVEAMAFAWLGWCYLNDLPGNWPDATGASGRRVLGSYTPV